MRIHDKRFVVNGEFSKQQFHLIYQKRIEKLKPLILPQMPPPIFQQLSEVIQEQSCSIVGIIEKQLAKRPSVLEKYSQVYNDTKKEEPLQGSDEDILRLEDQTSRIQIIGLDPAEFPTGIVIGLYGVINSATITVKEVFYPILPPPKPLSPPDNEFKIAFISNLEIDNPSFDDGMKQSLQRLLSSFQAVVFLGNNFQEPAFNPKSEFLSFTDRLEAIAPFPIDQFDDYINGIQSSVVVMPGKNDPVVRRYPQQPYHRVLISKAERTTNPAVFDVNGIQFLCESQEPIQDIVNTTNLPFHQVQRSMLNWLHLIPTAPDQLPCVPVTVGDLMVIEELPNFFVVGGAPAFETSTFCENCVVVSVPSFTTTRTIGVVDLGSGNAIEMNL